MKYLFLLAFCCQFSGLSAQDSLAKTAVPGLLQTLHDTLVLLHPIGPTEGGETLLAGGLQKARMAFATLRDRPGDSISYLEFFRVSGSLQEQLGDGHLTLDRRLPPPLRDSLRGANRLPLYLTADRGYVTLLPIPVAPGDTLGRGARVQAVDGRATVDVIGDLSAWAGLNDGGQSIGARYRAALAFPSNYQCLTKLRDSISLTVVDTLGNRREVYFKTRPASRRESEELPSPTPKPRKRRRSEGPLPGYWSLSRVDSGEVWHWRVGSFNHGNLNRANFRRLVRGVIDTLNENGVDKLILDLRGNPGGRIKSATTLLRALNAGRVRPSESFRSYSPNGNGKNVFGAVSHWLRGVRKREGAYEKRYLMRGKKPLPEDRRYIGSLVVLIDQATFSASGIVANQLQATGRATLIGRPTGSSAGRSYGGHRHQYSFGPGGTLLLSMMDYELILAPSRPGTITPDVPFDVLRYMVLDEIDHTKHFARDYLLRETAGPQ